MKVISSSHGDVVEIKSGSSRETADEFLEPVTCTIQMTADEP